MASAKFISSQSLIRAFRTLFFMIFMLFSFLLSSAPLLVSLMDIMAPCILLSFFACCTSCFRLNHDWMTSYSFRTSLMDIPLMSLLRSLTIFCVYSICGMPRLTYAPYVSTTAICAAISAIVLVFKAIIWSGHDLVLFHVSSGSADSLHMKEAWGIYSLFSCSMALALGHMMVAYKVKCQAQRKMNLYRLDPEAVISLTTFLYATSRYHKQPSFYSTWEDGAAQKFAAKVLASQGKF